MTGTLIKFIGGQSTILLDDGQVLENIALRGIFRHEDIKPLVGDRVEICRGGWQSARNDTGRLPSSHTNHDTIVQKILPRRNALIRPPIANVDCLLLVLSQAPPKSDSGLADSLTVTAECYGIDVVIAVNKADIDVGKVWREHYAASGYPCFSVSAETGQGVNELKAALSGKTIVLAGKSGVGKSSLLNALFPELNLQVGGISERLKLGKHTTRHVELLPCDRSLIADTPGFTIYDPGCIKGMTPNELAECYPEMRPYIDQCKYRSCRHERDEGCAVIKAVQEGKINPERHATYVALLREC